MVEGNERGHTTLFDLMHVPLSINQGLDEGKELHPRLQALLSHTKRESSSDERVERGSSPETAIRVSGWYSGAWAVRWVGRGVLAAQAGAPPCTSVCVGRSTVLYCGQDGSAHPLVSIAAQVGVPPCTAVRQRRPPHDPPGAGPGPGGRHEVAAVPGEAGELAGVSRMSRSVSGKHWWATRPPCDPEQGVSGAALPTLSLPIPQIRNLSLPLPYSCSLA